MRKKLIIALLNCTLILLASSFCAFGQETDLKDKRVTIKMDKQHLALVFRFLMENYDIPIGFEESILDREHGDYDFEPNLPAVGVKKMVSLDGKSTLTIEIETEFEAKKHWITINAENERLEDVLDKIIRQMKNYKWEINDGVVNIFPVRGRDERFEKLLATNINNFTFEQGKTVRTITTNIKKLPEFRKFLDENNLYFTGFRAGADSQLWAQYGRKINVEMNFSNLTFRELLNKITKIKRGGWVLKWKSVSSSGEEHINVDI